MRNDFCRRSASWIIKTSEPRNKIYISRRSAAMWTAVPSCHVVYLRCTLAFLDAERSAFDRTRIDSDPCPCCWCCRLQTREKRFCLKIRHLQISWLIIIFLMIMAQHREKYIIFRHTQLVIRFLIADRRLISILTKITREPKGAKQEDSQWEHVNWHQWTLFLDDCLRH